MKLFRVKVKDDFMGIFEIYIFADNEKEAIEFAKEHPMVGTRTLEVIELNSQKGIVSVSFYWE